MRFSIPAIAAGLLLGVSAYAQAEEPYREMGRISAFLLVCITYGAEDNEGTMRAFNNLSGALQEASEAASEEAASQFWRGAVEGPESLRDLASNEWKEPEELLRHYFTPERCRQFAQQAESLLRR